MVLFRPAGLAVHLEDFKIPFGELSGDWVKITPRKLYKAIAEEKSQDQNKDDHMLAAYSLGQNSLTVGKQAP